MLLLWEHTQKRARHSYTTARAQMGQSAIGPIHTQQASSDKASWRSSSHTRTLRCCPRPVRRSNKTEPFSFLYSPRTSEHLVVLGEIRPFLDELSSSAVRAIRVLFLAVVCSDTQCSGLHSRYYEYRRSSALTRENAKVTVGLFTALLKQTKFVVYSPLGLPMYRDGYRVKFQVVVTLEGFSI